MRRTVWTAFSLLLLVSLALAGCGQRITAEEIVAKMRETLDSTQDAHGVVSVQVNAQGVEQSATAEVWEKAPNKVRAVVLAASEADLVGVTAVSDGEQGWYYEPARNQVVVSPAGEMEMPLPQEMLTEAQQVIQRVLDASDVELAGEEPVAGRDAYKLTLSPKEGADPEVFPGGGTATLWVDKERWIVLKAVYEADTLGQGSLEVQSYELNPGLPDDLFTFQVPEGAKVVDASTLRPVFLTLDEAKAQATFPLLVPEYVPEGTTLIEVYKVGETIYLHYDSSPQTSFTIRQGPNPPGVVDQGGPSESITVRGQDGSLMTIPEQNYTFLSWDEEGVITVLAGHISLEEALRVAESLK